MYTLNHNKGSMSFTTSFDAIRAMYLVAEYDSDCAAVFTGTSSEFDRISRILDSKGFYSQGFLSICS
jgi:hypothetical protein